MSHGHRGNYAEHRVAEELRNWGWVVKGTGDAHGTTDLIGLREGRTPILVQVKATAAKRGPFADFKPAERRALIEEAELAGANAWLAWRPPDRKGTRWIEPDEWPPLR